MNLVFVFCENLGKRSQKLSLALKKSIYLSRDSYRLYRSLQLPVFHLKNRAIE